MARTFWLTFRLHDDAGYADRYDALHDAIAQLAIGDWWVETSSFFLFSAEESATVVARAIAQAIDLQVDTVLLGQTEYKVMRIIGKKSELHTLQKLVPFVK